jgi:hypothetical protein
LYVYMPTKSYALIPCHLQDCNVQSWENSFFPILKEYINVLGAKKSILEVDIDQGTSHSCPYMS